MFQRVTLLLVLLAAPAWACAAKGKDYDRIYAQCLKQAGGANNGTVAACSEMTSEQAKAEMGELYNAIHGRFLAENPQSALQLEKAQKSWLAYRKSHCDLAGQHIGSPMFDYCPMQLNIRRVMELREMAGL